ncbi:hypothetical protein [Methylobacterium oxalidis]|uniref:Flagellar assembly protein FliH/Type III secretion system HrpE domain-containing protein n=1 Tax=Methylobacterium oxalidis TaxID=944322 RepID=A0A512IZN4_9HYPH|nr:hypothetical protein [Methylobacterium oxalidis]GEP03178.1 hypothetical protein MOX02_12160 [Methylobacterium oxalidis]GJE30882.1 hypothetical protein LDDCCGHA_1052 [Methylobacterium oxalidis]GLS67437.1 hypothetical protein GCM10007888_58210 [Methylobacterium oxalidis]
MQAVLARHLPDFSAPGPAPAPPPPARAVFPVAPVPNPATDTFADPWIGLTRSGPGSAPAEPPEDREALLREAEARGRARGLAEAEDRRAAEEAAFAARFEAERRRWSETEAEALAAGFSAALRALDASLTERIARLLAPVLTDALRRRALSELGAALSRLLADPHHAAIRVSGPQDLLDGLAARLGPLGAAVAFAPADLPEVQVSADQTVIETQLGAWTRLLSAAIEEA